jgi:hypothetical protein
MIRKLGKANWVYRCSLCDYTSRRSVDMFGAQEAEQRHRHSTSHQAEVLTQAFIAAVEPMTTIMQRLGVAWGISAQSLARAVAQTQDDFGRAE